MERQRRMAERDALFQQHETRLSHMANRALHRGLRREQILAVAIDVDDPSWTREAEMLMPGHDWNKIRERGERPIARGVVQRRGLGDHLRRVVPDIADELESELPPGKVRAVVMGSGGASVYHIDPTLDPRTN